MILEAELAWGRVHLPSEARRVQVAVQRVARLVELLNRSRVVLSNAKIFSVVN